MYNYIDVCIILWKNKDYKLIFVVFSWNFVPPEWDGEIIYDPLTHYILLINNMLSQYICSSPNKFYTIPLYFQITKLEFYSLLELLYLCSYESWAYKNLSNILILFVLFHKLYRFLRSDDGQCLTNVTYWHDIVNMSSPLFIGRLR